MIRIPDDFVRQFSPADFLSNCHEAFAGYGNGTHRMEPREEEVRGSRYTLKMPASIPGYTGYKFIDEISDVSTGRLGSKTAVIRLKPGSSEEVEMSAEYITSMRTGAAGALGVRYFAPYARDISILGTGNVAKALALCVNELDVRRINVYSRTSEKREKFKSEVQDLVGAEIILHDSQKSCIKTCDAILAAVPTLEPILSYDDFGCSYISCMGGDSRTAQLSEEMLFRPTIVPDNEAQCWRSGEFRRAIEKGREGDINFAMIGGRTANIGDAANGRLKLDGKVIAYFTGLAVQDMSAAKMIYERFTGSSL
ncbi:MAG: NAD(P)-binding domain-containing protein [Candidatus Aenigmarchaeota archaeon]|nr:NAD(P)-binding domain-containing protein [Candidatus Aenigmarchaeota archaeon]